MGKYTAPVDFLLILLGLSQVSNGDEPLYLMPADFAPAQVSVPVRLVVGQSPVPWSSAPASYLFVKTTSTQENQDDAASWIASDGTFVAPLVGGGPAMIGVDFRPRTVRGKTVHRTAVTLVRGRMDGNQPDGAVTTSRSGLTAEIRPMIDPTRFQGGDLAFRVYAGGEAAESGTLLAVSASGKRATVTLDPKGFGHFTPQERGLWKLTFKTERGGSAYVATLTFKLPTAQEGKP